MADSPLVNKFMQAYSGNYTKNRSAYSSIKAITIHHVAGNATIEGLGALWQKVGRKGSSHYGVQHGNVGQYVLEKDIAWTNSYWPSNIQSVTIETSNDGGAPDWHVADDTLRTLIKLVADIAQRNNLYPLVVGQNLTWHSMFAATNCPGPYLLGKIEYIATEANKIVSGGAPETTQPSQENEKPYRVRLSANDAGSQIIALSDETSAINYAKQHPGYSVYDKNGALVYQGNSSIQVGDTVRITADTYSTGQNIPTWVKNGNHVVSKITGDKALLGYPNGISSWVAISGLVKV